MCDDTLFRVRLLSDIDCLRSVPLLIEAIDELIAKRCSFTNDMIELYCCICMSILSAKKNQYEILVEKLESMFNEPSSNKVGLVELMIANAQKEIVGLCENIDIHLQNKMIPHAKTKLHTLRLLKLKADNLKFCCECYKGGKSEEYTNRAEFSYSNALKFANDKVDKIESLKLGLIFNYTTFIYKVRNNPVEAYKYLEEYSTNAKPTILKIESPEFSSLINLMNILKEVLAESIEGEQAMS
jgi:hypothetical protein